MRSNDAHLFTFNHGLVEYIAQHKSIENKRGYLIITSHTRGLWHMGVQKCPIPFMFLKATNTFHTYTECTKQRTQHEKQHMRSNWTNDYRRNKMQPHLFNLLYRGEFWNLFYLNSNLGILLRIHALFLKWNLRKRDTLATLRHFTVL